MKEKHSHSLKGRLVASGGSVHDDSFFESVVLMIEHDESGAFGLVINHESENTLQDIFPFFQTGVENVFLGGPVRPEAIFALYRDRDLGHLGREIASEVFLGSSIELFKSLSQSEEPYRILSGYSGWGPGQLEGELSAKSWVVTHEPAELIFDIDPEDIWRVLLQEQGGLFSYYAENVNDPRLN